MRILICGDRNWTNPTPIYRILNNLDKKDIIIHGACRGADLLAGLIAKELGFIVEEYPAQWGKYGKAAGPLRNREMLNSGANLVIAFHEDIKKSRGTINTIRQAQELNIPVILVTK